MEILGEKPNSAALCFSVLRLNPYTADNIQISSHEKRVEKMNYCCFEQEVFIEQRIKMKKGKIGNT